jgi:hypothetical protein
MHRDDVAVAVAINKKVGAIEARGNRALRGRSESVKVRQNQRTYKHPKKDGDSFRSRDAGDAG